MLRYFSNFKCVFLETWQQSSFEPTLWHCDGSVQAKMSIFSLWVYIYNIRCNFMCEGNSHFFFWNTHTKKFLCPIFVISFENILTFLYSLNFKYFLFAKIFHWKYHLNNDDNTSTYHNEVTESSGKFTQSIYMERPTIFLRREGERDWITSHRNKIKVNGLMTIYLK